MIRGLYEAARQLLRAFALIRFRHVCSQRTFLTYAEAKADFEALPEETRVWRPWETPILMWWPGSGWVPVPWDGGYP